jgi:hypothetical protein
LQHSLKTQVWFTRLAALFENAELGRARVPLASTS